MENENFETQLAEAEERGYQRGLNEQISKKMELPGEWEGAVAIDDDGMPAILGSISSIWD